MRCTGQICIACDDPIHGPGVFFRVAGVATTHTHRGLCTERLTGELLA